MTTDIPDKPCDQHTDGACDKAICGKCGKYKFKTEPCGWCRPWPESKAEPPKRTQPPLVCASCRTPIAKYLQPGATWYPCTDCNGDLCEKCCEEKKKQPKTPEVDESHDATPQVLKFIELLTAGVQGPSRMSVGDVLKAAQDAKLPVASVSFKGKSR